MTRELYFPNGETIPSAPSPADVLNAVKQSDGPGSGLDADLYKSGLAVKGAVGPRNTGTPDIGLGYNGTEVTVTVDGVDKGDIAYKADLTNINTGVPLVTQLCQGTHNSSWMLVDGELFTSSGKSNVYGNSTTGRGLRGTLPVNGIDNLKVVSRRTNSPIVKVGGGYYTFMYTLHANGELYTWGANTNGQCGLGSTVEIPFPTLAATGVVEIYDHPSNGHYSVNNNRLFIKKSDGYIYGCGGNSNGGLGLGDSTNRNIFTQISALGVNGVSKLFNLGSNSGCTVVLTTDGRILICGYNAYGNLGLSNNTNIITNFTDVTTAWAGVSSGVQDIKVTGIFGYSSSSTLYVSTLLMLITLPDGSKIVRTCGDNTWGQLGNGNTTAVNTPITPLSLPSNIVDIATSTELTFHALTDTGDLYGWGFNGFGNVGDGTTTNRSTPIVVKTNIAKLHTDGWTCHSYGYYISTFVEDINGRLWSCGYNANGEGGTGTTANNLSFNEVLLPSDEQVHLLGSTSSTNGGLATICITKKGNMYVWGYTGYSQIYGYNFGLNKIPYPQSMEIPRLNETIVY